VDVSSLVDGAGGGGSKLTALDNLNVPLTDSTVSKSYTVITVA